MKKQYMGIRCGPDWCEVGNSQAFVPSESHMSLAESFSDLSSRRTVEVKGWYDEQYLATAGDGELQPSAIVGTIFPDLMLESYDDEAADFRTFTPVARVALRVDPSVLRDEALTRGDVQLYKDKFNFDLTPDESLNRISVCRGSAESCGIPDGEVPPDSERPEGPKCTDVDDPWWATIEGLTGAPKFYCIKRHTAGLDPPGTVRWRWLASDEGEWIRCIKGCCEVHGPH
jgi:hypothetical protein